MNHNFKRGLQLYFSSILIYSLGLLLFRSASFYDNLVPQTQQTLLYLFITYLVCSPIYYYFTVNSSSENKPYLFLRMLWRNVRQLIVNHKSNGTLRHAIYYTSKSRQVPLLTKFAISIHLESEEKVAVLFLLVKLFYIPLMTNFFFTNWSELSFKNIEWYPFLLILLFTIDTLIFTVGYAFEFPSSRVRSVEPTIFGWFVALVCYPPFNSMVGKYVPWGANDYVQFGNYTLIARIFVVALLIIYVWASVALGLKASNLTNRGIVSRFPYSIIRHPAYISKNLIWWVTLIPVMTWPFALGIGFWTVIYFFRAYTEERHLLKDPDYVEYCKKVKWKFIPYLY